MGEGAAGEGPWGVGGWAWGVVDGRRRCGEGPWGVVDEGLSGLSCRRVVDLRTSIVGRRGWGTRSGQASHRGQGWQRENGSHRR